jgi:carboxypeptidase Taq
MQEKFQQLVSRVNEIMDLSFISALLGWDHQTYMPQGGAEDRGYHQSTLSGLIHRKITSPEIGQLLEELEPYKNQLDPDSNEACLLDLTRYEYEQRTKVPTEWVAEFARLTTIAETAWEKARANSDFKSFQPYLEKIVVMLRQYADFFAPYDHVYDPLLNGYERGMKTAEVKAIFDTLRTQQVELIHAISERMQVDDSFLHVPYADQPLWDFGVDVISRFGFDWKRGRQDKSIHPFTSNFGINDVRITTRFDPAIPLSSLFSTMHEGGHALYEQGIDPALQRTPLAAGASMAVHESQSRMFENLVGRSLPFWKYFYPRLQERYPAQLGSVALDTFYKGINKVEPSLIRVEADEATYNLHIMLRLELEIALMEGNLQAADLPDAWNERMKEYLGLTPPNDAKGVLQDVHWSGGSIGYFPTYALGNLVSAQLWECIHTEIPDLDAQIEQGKFEDLLGWLRKNIHRHGAKYKPQELIQKVTGSRISPEPYLRYLDSKYSEIYGL